jgi:hypothetical protein
MKRLILMGALVGAFAASTAFAQSGMSGTTPLGSVHINTNVLADGKPLPAGTYQVRLTPDEPKPGVGQSPGAEQYVEFLKGGKVVAREVATVVTAGDIGKIAKGGARPPAGGSVFQLLKGGDYGRVWFNHKGMNYLINLPVKA